jgi:hypothetical protein
MYMRVAIELTGVCNNRVLLSKELMKLLSCTMVTNPRSMLIALYPDILREAMPSMMLTDKGVHRSRLCVTTILKFIQGLNFHVVFGHKPIQWV